jgi:hypothetical protein
LSRVTVGAVVFEDDRAAALADDEFADAMVRPDYGGYCFSGVPAAAADRVGVDLGEGLPEDAFGAGHENPAHVVVLFVDSLGYRQFERVAEDVPFLQAFRDSGQVTPLTSTYPSETAACVTTMATATDPVEHGVLGWNAYDPEADTVYEVLPYAAKDGGEISVRPDDLFDVEPIYPRLREAGVDPHVVGPDYGPGYDDAATAGATAHHYERTTEFALALRDVIRGADAPSYTYAYYPFVDAAAHEYGPGSDEADAQAAAVGDALERALGSLDDAVAEETLVCLVADHGQVDVSETTVDLAGTGVLEHVQTDRSGAPLALGGPRNLHLRVTDETAARECLADLDAVVLGRDEALDAGLWGRGEPGPAFDRNAGDLLVIPRDAMLLPTRDDGEWGLAGMHGGLNPREAIVPFGVAWASALA